MLPQPIAQPRLDEPDRDRTAEVTNTAVVLPFPQPIATTDVPPARHEASAAAVRLGPEGLSRLRARHAEILARVDEKIADPVRREQLKGDAERLNPDTWVTDAEVTTGLESYETVFETLRSVIGRRRKRRRRRTSGEGIAETAVTGQPEEPAPAGAPASSDDDDPADADDEPADL